MLSKIVEIMLAAAILFGALGGRMGDVSSQSASAAAQAVTTVLSMAGSICFWSGMMEIMAESGLSQLLTRALKYPIRLIYGPLGGDERAIGLLGQNMAANILGLGSAATPAGLAAAGRLRELRDRGRIGKGPLVLLTVVNTVSLQLIPATVAAARASLGAEQPYDILVCVWCASICSFLAAVIFARALKGGEN